MVLGWNRSDSWYQIVIPKHTSIDVGLGNEGYLVFNLVDGRGLIEDGEILDFTIVVQDDDGEKASILLSEVNRLLPQLPVQFTRLPTWEKEDYKNPTEVVFQTFRIQLSDFFDLNPQINPEKIRTIRFVFDQDASGAVILDEVGFDLN